MEAPKSILQSASQVQHSEPAWSPEQAPNQEPA